MSLPEAAADRQVWSVSEFVGISRDLLERAMPFVWVRGEISRMVRHASGHWYFTLKDESAHVPVVMFRSANRKTRFDVDEGMEIIVGGAATVYAAQGKFQVVAEILEPVGWGALQLAYEQLKTRLADEGLFDAANKRALPILPRFVGVVTSPSGAAWRDLTRVWEKNQVPIRILLSPARVQGDRAAAEIVAAIDRLNRHGEADVMIVGRGGGSREDLWAFNEESVARAIAASAIPVVSAVGHAIDETIADWAADARAATPTAAAELVAASRTTLTGRLTALQRRADGAVTQRLLRSRNRLQAGDLQRNLRRPSRLLRGFRQRLDDGFSRVDDNLDHRLGACRRTLDDAAHRIGTRSPAAIALRRRGRAEAALQRAQAATLRTLDHHKARLGAAAARLEALSPLAVLGRGYAICSTAGAADASERTIVRAAADVDTGDRVRVRLEADILECTVDATAKPTDRTGL